MDGTGALVQLNPSGGGANDAGLGTGVRWCIFGLWVSQNEEGHRQACRR